jgi:hypothetical protein
LSANTGAWSSTCAAKIADSVIIWGGWSEVLEQFVPWDSNADWWLETLDLISNPRPSWTPKSVDLNNWFSSAWSTFTFSGSSDVVTWWDAALSQMTFTRHSSDPIPAVVQASGYNAVRFSASSSTCLIADTVAAIIGTTTFSVLCCLSIARNSSNASDSWTNSGIFGDNNGQVGMTVVGTSSPVTVRACMWDGADKHADLSANLATKVVLLMWFDGSYLNASINNGTSE